MKQQEPRYVILRVEKDRLDNFEIGLDQAMLRKKYGVDVATRTEAQLSGEDFGIIAQEVSARKIVPEGVYQEWRWQVTPKSSGPHRLVLVVSPIAQIKDVGIGSTVEGETPIGTPYRDQRDVDVSRNWAYLFREQTPALSNIVIGTILGVLITIIGSIIKQRTNRPSGKPPENPEV